MMQHVSRQVAAIAAELAAALADLAADICRDFRALAAEMAGRGTR